MEHKPEKCTCEMAAKVEAARKTLGEAERSGARDGQVKAAREALIKLEQEHMKLVR